ncbi:MAG: hypothetical protein QOE77_1139 [Blastocatellia bacterium]|jgi:DUF4097 and DUF4098 domain-containing protein YvlB|nr:hypothetical protein [Blastocatellia bacterium]
MKRILIVVVLVVLAGVAGLMRAQRSRSDAPAAQQAAGEIWSSDGEVREDLRKTYQLAPDAQLSISGINGRVDIKTSETDTAEVHVVRTATSRENLDRRQVIIEQTSAGLIIRAENHGSWWSHLWGSTPKEEITVSAPRRIALTLKGINGRVNGGDVDGAIDVTGVNGKVELSQAKGSAKISGINGNISLGLRDLNERGVQASGVNGSLELRLGAGLNADLVAKGMNGRVRSDIPEVSVQEGEYGSHYSAHIGSGGTPINISGINGNVSLTRLGAAVGEKVTPEKKSAASAKPAL